MLGGVHAVVCASVRLLHGAGAGATRGVQQSSCAGQKAWKAPINTFTTSSLPPPPPPVKTPLLGRCLSCTASWMARTASVAASSSSTRWVGGM